MKCVKDVSLKEKGGQRSMGSDFHKLCKKIGSLSQPEIPECCEAANANMENLEVYSSFRPTVSATISAEKLEQILLSSESDSEPEETGTWQGGDQLGEINLSYREVRYSRRLEAAKIKTTERSKSIKSRLCSVSNPAVSSHPVSSLLTLHPTWLRNTLGPSCPPPQSKKITRSASTPHVQPSAVVWRIGKPTNKHGIVFCPGDKCNSKHGIRYSNISSHIAKHHAGILRTLRITRGRGGSEERGGGSEERGGGSGKVKDMTRALLKNYLHLPNRLEILVFAGINNRCYRYPSR